MAFISDTIYPAAEQAGNEAFDHRPTIATGASEVDLKGSAPSLQARVLRVVLRGISPLEIVFAWSDEHLHSFSIHGRAYGSSGANTHQVWRSNLRLHRGERFRYIYNFCACWECYIRLEALLPLAPRRVYPVVCQESWVLVHF